MLKQTTMLKQTLAGLLIALAATQPAIAQDAAKPSDAPALIPAAAPGEGPAPQDAIPDPLTPPKADLGPAVAPGAVPRPAPPAAVAAADDPIVAATLARLATWPEPRTAGDRADLAALKSFYGEAAAKPVWTDAKGFTERALGIITMLQQADTHGLDAAAYVVPPPPVSGAKPEALAETEIRLGQAALAYARHARGGRLDPTALSKMIDMRPRPYEPRSVLDALAATPATDTYLHGLHPQHAGFVALRTALAKARAENAGPDAQRRLIVNMERWRWLPDDLGAFHVWDNVPEQVTRVFHDGRVTLKERIVVGKTDTPTPVFSARMQFVIFHPSWGVPEGIKANELAPMLRRAQANSSSGWLFGDSGNGPSRALARHELRVYQGGREVNPDRVNWATTDPRQFQFTQAPSAKNVLGVVKFRFPNKFDVYMHDTTERHLFSRSPRLYSHGCMRVENPLKLAETILGYDKGWGRDKIAAMVARGTTTDVTLEKNVPVHIVYFTASVDEAGRLATFPDPYGLDNRVASALAGKTVAIAAPKPAPDVEATAAKAKDPAAKKSAERVKAPKKPANQGFDPFAFLSSN